MRYGIRKFGSSTTSYAAFSGKRPEHDYRSDLPAAMVGLERGGFPASYFTDDDGNTHDNQRIAYPETSRGGSLAWKPEQGKLFTETPSKISTAFSNKSMRAAVPTLLGMAINDANAIGTGLTHDSSLSKHSSPLARKGLKAGLLKENPNNPTAARTNNFSIDNAYRMPNYDAEMYETAPPEQIGAAKSTIRGIFQTMKNPAATEKQVLKGMSRGERTRSKWLDEYSAAPDAPSTAGHTREGELDLGHMHSPHAMANQHAWLTKHYSEPVEAPTGVHRDRIEEELETGQRRYVYGRENPGQALTEDEKAGMKAQLKAIPTEEKRSPSKAEWQDSAPKPGKGQRKLPGL